MSNVYDESHRKSLMRCGRMMGTILIVICNDVRWKRLNTVDLQGFLIDKNTHNDWWHVVAVGGDGDE